MPTVFVTRDIPDHGIKMLERRKGLRVSVYKKDGAIPRAELLRKVKGVDILLALLTDKIDAEVLQAAGPKLKMIANYAVGFDNIDLVEAKKRKIVVSNTPSPVVSEAVAEHALALIFALARRIVETDAWTRKGNYHGWGPKMFLGTDVKGKILGIVGGGAIGSALARRMHDGFDVKIVYADLKRNETLEQEYGATFMSKEKLLRHADFVSIHLPLLPSTHHYISTAELKLMKKTAYLINTARGPIVDELALTKALLSGDIAGAGLDVFECEPLIDCNPKDIYELAKLPNVILTPHTASATIEARQAMSEVAAKNILAYLDGKTPPNAVR